MLGHALGLLQHRCAARRCCAVHGRLAPARRGGAGRRGLPQAVLAALPLGLSAALHCAALEASSVLLCAVGLLRLLHVTLQVGCPARGDALRGASLVPIVVNQAGQRGTLLRLGQGGPAAELSGCLQSGESSALRAGMHSGEKADLCRLANDVVSPSSLHSLATLEACSNAIGTVSMLSPSGDNPSPPAGTLQQVHPCLAPVLTSAAGTTEHVRASEHSQP